MRTGISKPLIFVVTSVLVIVLIYSSSFELVQSLSASTKSCTQNFFTKECCWYESDPQKYPGRTVEVCQTCYDVEGGGKYTKCDPVECKLGCRGTIMQPGDKDGVLEEPPIPPPLQISLLEIQ
jgi:hypothetical protein